MIAIQKGLLLTGFPKAALDPLLPIILFWLFCMSPPIAFAQTGPLTEQLGRTVTYNDVAISPDGTHVAWAQTITAHWAPSLYVSSTSAGSTAVRIDSGMADERTDCDPAWSPDSRTLAFLSTSGEKDQAQLWTASADGSGVRKRTRLKGYAARPRWSHDGKRIAFLHVEGASGGGPLSAAPRMTGVIDTAFHNQRIAVLDLSTDRLVEASPADLHIYDYDWSPDDQRFVTTAAPGPGDNNWWIARIYLVDIAKQAATPIYQPALQVAIPRWAPDGRSVAFIEGLMSDEGFHGGDLCTISAEGNGRINLTEGRKTSISSFLWTMPNRILLTEFAGGGSAVAALNLKDRSVHTLWSGGEDVHAFGNFPNFAVAADGDTTAVVRSSLGQAPEVWAGRIGQWHCLTRNNTAQFPAWGNVESLTWTNEGLNLQGWLLQPKQEQSNKRSPMVVMIHGGPSGIEIPEWPTRFALAPVLASQGYYVLMPNPRGSYGQGEAFTKANVKDFGGGDLRDILAGVDTALLRHPIDPNRLGVTGWSYGGYMTMWTVTQTKRFRAAMAGAGIANWQSYYGQNLIDQWMIPFFGASVYDDPGVYQKSSPIQFIKNVTTPTLVVVGERDAECPSPQSYEFWHALRALGTATELVVYAEEGHLFQDPKNRVDVQDRTVAWFDRYLK
jgi:dipeptidyl aminopeptidase/acylaminoacyl peptidase